MDALERGGLANPDEKRMVGHYWLRAPDLAPTPNITAEVRNTLAAIKRFAGAVHDGGIRTPAGVRFTQVLRLGIGGSALGPMFVADALGNPGGHGPQGHGRPPLQGPLAALQPLPATTGHGIARQAPELQGRAGRSG